MINLTPKQQDHICEVCRKSDATVREFAEDFDLQTALADYLEQVSGEKVNVADVTRLCTECYEKINLPQNPLEEEDGRSAGL